jgi:hypothetical protein
MRLFISLGKEICKERLCTGAYLSIGGSVGGNMEGGSFTGDFERRVTIWKAPPIGSPTDMFKKSLKRGISLHRGPTGRK